MTNDEIRRRGLATVWHPCTQMKDHEFLPLVPIKRGSGVWLEDFDGNHYLDAVSSWWVNLFGHCHPYINAAVKRQIETLEHVLLAGFTHEPVVQLSERLIQIAPPGLSRCFYADNGSSAVEIALKMSFHYWRNNGNSHRQKFITLSNSYHGETLGALSVGDVDLYKKVYKPLLLDVITVESPDCYYRDAGESTTQYSLRQFERMERVLQQNAHEVCAVIVEPLVQCAGNMRMYDPVYLSKLRDACNRYDVHLIADEIAVGFGRTGTLFACEQAHITPDFLCLSKGLTGGYLPLSVVLSTEKIYQAFYDDYEKLNAFLHSHSYTGNPLGCSAALATLDLIEQENCIDTNRTRAKQMRAAVESLQDHPHVSDVRQCGMILAIELVKNKGTKTHYPWQERRGLKVYQYGLRHGVLLRPLGNVVYFMPPYIITDDQISLMCDVAIKAIEFATKVD